MRTPRRETLKRHVLRGVPCPVIRPDGTVGHGAISTPNKDRLRVKFAQKRATAPLADRGRRDRSARAVAARFRFGQSPLKFDTHLLILPRSRAAR